MEPEGRRRRQSAMSRTALPSILVVLILSLSACASTGGSSDGSDGGGGGGGGSGSPGESEGGASGGIPHPSGTDLVLSVTSEGGFVPVEFAVTQLPTFVLLGDGRVITQGAMTLEFPGPLVPPLQVRTLTEDGIQRVLEGVIDTGLFNEDIELRGAANMVADAADTVFTVHAGDREVRVAVYGLGTLLPDMPTQGIDPAEVEAHGTLQRLVDQLSLIDQTLPADAFADDGWQPFTADAYRIYVRDATGEPEGDLPAQVREWPTDDDPATMGEEEALFGNGTRCAVVDGEVWAAELAEATQNTRWTTDGETGYAIAARPILPHEEPICPELQPGA